MKGLLIVNAYWHSPLCAYQPKRLQEEFGALGVPIEVRTNEEATAAMAKGDEWTKEYRFCLFWDKDLYLAQRLEQAGMAVINSSETIRVCDDKVLTCLALEKGGYAIPKTIALPLAFHGETPSDAFVDSAADVLGWPMVVKQVNGSLGEGVALVQNKAELYETVRGAEGRCLLQAFVAASAGRDVRVLVVGDKVLGAMQRVGTDFRSNAALGGKALPYALSDEEKKHCVAIAKTLGLDYCGIDLLWGEKEKPVCEVNSNAFFQTFEQTTNINVAREYARYVVGKWCTKHAETVD